MVDGLYIWTYSEINEFYTKRSMRVGIIGFGVMCLIGFTQRALGASDTDSPTSAPTDAPTNAPMNAPTAAPTNKPTAAPITVICSESSGTFSACIARDVHVLYKIECLRYLKCHPSEAHDKFGDLQI